MVCTTIRKGSECTFMTKQGCSYNGGICHQVVEQCNGCSRSENISSAWYCSACPEPSTKWKNGSCNLATHVASTSSGNKVKINPLKASKRSRK